MAGCKKITKKNSKVCIGDMDKKITILTRSLISNSTSVDFSIVYTTVASVWALVMVTGGRIQFDTTQLIDSKDTHSFYIRYREGVTQENVIGFKGEYYNITNVRNLDEDNKFLRIEAVVRGKDDEEINLT